MLLSSTILIWFIRVFDFSQYAPLGYTLCLSLHLHSEHYNVEYMILIYYPVIDIPLIYQVWCRDHKETATQYSLAT